MKIFFSALVALVIFSGCVSSEKQIVLNTKQTPSWYENPTQSTGNLLYATAQGDTKETAIARALNEIVSTLSISVSSLFSSDTKRTQSTYNQTSSSKIRTRVKEIKISHYEVINESDFGFERYLVQVRVDKKKLFSSLEKEIQQKLAIVHKREQGNYNAIKRLRIYKEDLKSLEYVKNTLPIMDSLNSNFNPKEYLNKVLNLENRHANLLARLSFSIDTNHNAKHLKSTVLDGLAKEELRVNDSMNKEHFRIYLEADTKKASAYGFDLARCALSISVKDYAGTIISSNKLNIVGQSTQGYGVAKENVAVKLNKIIRKDGIFKVIGLDL